MCNSIATKDMTSHRRAFSLCAIGLCQLLLLGVSGCRTTTDNQIDLLERELRVQEDYIYELEGYVVDYSEKLRDCRGCSPPQTAAYSEEVYRPAPERSSSKKPAARSSKQEKSIIDPPQEEQPQEELPAADELTPEEILPEDMKVPDLDLEMEDPVTRREQRDEFQQVAAVELDYRSAEGEPLTIPDPVDFETRQSDDNASDEFVDNEITPASSDVFDEQPASELSPKTPSRAPERLEVKHLFRSGETDSAESNLLTVVEALDENDEPVDLDGEVSLMVMTPDQSGELKRIKRWNFTAEETISAWQSSELGDGLHLELPLAEVQLPKSSLELWARLVTADGRKLLTKLPFDTQTLAALGDDAPQPRATETELASTDSPSSNPLRSTTSSRSSTSSRSTTTSSVPTDDHLRLATKETSGNQPRWRSSKHHSVTSSADSSTTSNATGWTKQSPRRLNYRPAK